MCVFSWRVTLAGKMLVLASGNSTSKQRLAVKTALVFSLAKKRRHSVVQSKCPFIQFCTRLFLPLAGLDGP